MMTVRFTKYLMLPLLAMPAWVLSAEPGKQVFRCPGNPVLYTDSLSAKEAKDKGCRTLDGAPITIIQITKPRPGSTVAAGSSPSREGAKVDPNEQRARDTDARRILESELKKEEEQLGTLQKEYNAGEPERRGDEKNFAKFQERAAEMKAAIARKEADVAALKREIAKLP